MARSPGVTMLLGPVQIVYKRFCYGIVVGLRRSSCLGMAGWDKVRENSFELLQTIHNARLAVKRAWRSSPARAPALYHPRIPGIFLKFSAFRPLLNFPF